MGKDLAAYRKAKIGSGVYERQRCYVASLVQRDLELRLELVEAAKVKSTVEHVIVNTNSKLM